MATGERDGGRLDPAGGPGAGAAEPAGRLWCAGREGADYCAGRLAATVGTEPTPAGASIADPQARWFLRLYAFQVFVVGFALAHFLVRARPLLANPATTLLTVWVAYTTAVVTQVATIHIGSGAALIDPSLDFVVRQWLPPAGLGRTLFAAPAVAAVHLLVARLRRGRQPSQPGVTSPAS
ncbi:hypothetical protein [Jiangella sp. DSM 45060]|uniref:hypothetical protein n=1 Tax=Jiangella sp. DSM 45060 TaxID=1798224 RepID=UPI00087D117F|nr:hypothetical protein [Jiangella sp. DSM 45060]SDS97753.1 hypothetical protein SAMN04515669_2437 [Jiangella sp. DSM 45060]